MKNFLPLLLLPAFILVLGSCKKDKDPAPPTKADFLTAKPWKTTALTVNPRLPSNNSGGTPLPADLYAYYQNNNGQCINDDVKVFKKNPATYSLEEGATKCDPTDPQVFDTGTWTFSSDENTLALTSAATGSLRNYTLLELSATTLRYTYTVTTQGSDTSPSVTYTFTETLSNQ